MAKDDWNDERELHTRFPDKDSVHVTEVKPKSTEHAIDLRNELHPSSVCVCGADLWIVYAKFDEEGMVAYFMDIQCANCGSMATAPTPGRLLLGDEEL